jgi:hypothetical protein
MVRDIYLMMMGKWSLLVKPSIELNTIACSLFGVISLAAMQAKFNVLSTLLIVVLDVGCM